MDIHFKNNFLLFLNFAEQKKTLISLSQYEIKTVNVLETALRSPAVRSSVSPLILQSQLLNL